MISWISFILSGKLYDGEVEKLNIHLQARDLSKQILEWHSVSKIAIDFWDHKVSKP